ncbi:hypothetical protein QCA50_013477 [Cerrena zonata]|uniref:40S ribosomal protein S30 n=1 Tax=Cerrena zonata TaxID=2478898 RepID=A0AAW0FL56_9APHY
MYSKSYPEYIQFNKDRALRMDHRYTQVHDEFVLNSKAAISSVESGSKRLSACSVQDLASPSPTPSTTAPATSRQYGKRSLLLVAVALDVFLLTHDVRLVHGSLARAGKVKSQTPKVDKQEKKKVPKGRAKKRILYNRRFVNVTTLPGGKRRMNANPEK